MNEKYIEGNGSVLDLVPQGTTLIVKGSTGSSAGLFLMKDTNLTITGDAGRRLGKYMSGGKIEIYGTAGRDVGEGSKGGEIHLKGDFESIADDAGADIYGDNFLVGAPQYATEMSKIEKYMMDVKMK